MQSRITKRQIAEESLAVAKASFAVLTAQHSRGERPPKSLTGGTSYLRIVFASADYCLTCSVALVLPWLRSASVLRPLLVFRRVSFAFLAVYIHIHARSVPTFKLAHDAFLVSPRETNLSTHYRFRRKSAPMNSRSKSG